MDDFEVFLKDHEQGLRRAVAQRVSRDVSARMTLFNEVPWNSDGFYAARSNSDLIDGGVPVGARELAFPVPADCPYWSDAQDFFGGGIVRALLRRAWLDVPNPDQKTTLHFMVCEAVDSGWIDTVSVFLGPERMHLASLEKVDGRVRLFWRARETMGVGRLVIECPSVGSSERWGRFSIVVTNPVWV